MTWQWRDGTAWRDFDPGLASQLDRAREAGQATCVYSFRGQPYEVDFQQETQVNKNTGFARDVRRLGDLASPAFAAPALEQELGVVDGRVGEPVDRARRAGIAPRHRAARVPLPGPERPRQAHGVENRPPELPRLAHAPHVQPLVVPPVVAARPGAADELVGEGRQPARVDVGELGLERRRLRAQRASGAAGEGSPRHFVPIAVHSSAAAQRVV